MMIDMSKAISSVILIVLAVAVIAVLGFVLTQQGQIIPTPTTPVAAPTFETQDTESSAVNVETSASDFVNDATPTTDQELPDLK